MEPCLQIPEPSGPRWASASRTGTRSAESAGRASSLKMPAIPHMSHPSVRALDDEGARRWGLRRRGARRSGGNALELLGQWVLRTKYSTVVLRHFGRCALGTNTTGIKNIVWRGLGSGPRGGKALSPVMIHSPVDVRFFCWLRLKRAVSNRTLRSLWSAKRMKDPLGFFCDTLLFPLGCDSELTASLSVSHRK